MRSFSSAWRWLAHVLLQLLWLLVVLVGFAFVYEQYRLWDSAYSDLDGGWFFSLVPGFLAFWTWIVGGVLIYDSWRRRSSPAPKDRPPS
jgi:hypothetical protein